MRYAAENPLVAQMLADFEETKRRNAIENQRMMLQAKEQTMRDVAATQGIIVPFM